jgi:hypothetical protein
MLAYIFIRNKMLICQKGNYLILRRLFHASIPLFSQGSGPSKKALEKVMEKSLNKAGESHGAKLTKVVLPVNKNTDPLKKDTTDVNKPEITPSSITDSKHSEVASINSKQKTIAEKGSHLPPGVHTPKGYFNSNNNDKPSVNSQDDPIEKPTTTPGFVFPVPKVGFSPIIIAIHPHVNPKDNVTTVNNTENTSNDTVESSTKQPVEESLDVILIEAVKRNIITYEPTKEDPTGGGAKLTKQGLELYKEIYPKVSTPAEEVQVNIDGKITYEVGMLHIDPNTVITLPIHTHLVVAHDNQTDKRIIIGVLTSEKGTTKLSDTQPISGNTDKAQYIKRLIVPLSVTNKQFEIHEKGTEYIQNVDIKDILEDLKKEVMKTKHVPYEPIGVTKEDLQKMFELQTKAQLQVKIIKEKPSNLDSEQKKKKDLEKQEKAKKNTIKQKEEAQKKKAELVPKDQSDQKEDI